MIGATDLAKQISDPAHVWIETRPGHYLRHSDTYIDPLTNEVHWLRGEPVRFTRLAARRFVRAYPKARLIDPTTRKAVA